MTTTSTNNELNLKTFVVWYRYSDDLNWFNKHISAESDEEALFDAKAFIESENAEVANKPKAGNHIEVACVREWSGRVIDVITF